MPVFSFNYDDSDDENDPGVGGRVVSTGGVKVGAVDETKDVDDDGEIEPPHPLGFAPSPWGKTWFSVDPPPRSLFTSPNSGQSKYSLDWSDEEDEEEEEEEKKVEDGISTTATKYVQSYPPISSYVDPQVAPTSARLQCQQRLDVQNHKQKSTERRRRRQQLEQHNQNVDGGGGRRRRFQNDDQELDYSEDDYDDEDEDDCDDVDGENSVALLKLFARQNVQRRIQQDPRLLSPPNARSADQAVRKEQEERQKRAETDAKVQKLIQQNRQKVERQLQENTRVLGEIILETEQKAAAVLKKQQQEEAKLRQQQEELKRQQQAARDKEERDAADAEEARRNAEEAKRRDDEKKKTEKEAKAAKEAEKTQHIRKAEYKVQQLVKLRASLEPFENNKAMSKRRLGMKKIAKGKVNTLSENADKVKEVAQLICNELTKIRGEDDQYKQGMDSGNPQITSDMTKGKRYFLDLLSSNTLTRIQADSFNGLKGDGFPLAGMLSMVSMENSDLDAVFAAHIFTVCPTAIPTLPAPKKDASEDEVMTALGMLKNNDGEFESFDKFLSRTENIITFMADVQSSLPEAHKLMGGHEGAILWLGRFLDMIPPPPTSPLPLITASVLTAFLTGAGHMMANKHTEEFKKYLSVITNDVVTRLDEGAIGKPSALRLTKLVSGGFDYFQKELPPKALPELYLGASGSSHRNVENLSYGGEIGGKQDQRQVPSNTSQQNSNPFGGGGSGSSGFGGGGAHNAPSPSPFGTTAPGTSAPASSPFGNPSSGAAPSPFGGGSSMAAPSTQSPFGGTTSTPATASTTPFGSTAAAPSPFGNSTADPSASPFGNPSGNPGMTSGPGQFGVKASSTPFGNNNNAPSPSPFGASTNNQTFGAGPGAATTAATPFGSTPNPTAQASPFGNSSATGSTPFGSSGFGPGAAPAPSPFGGGGGITSSSPFGQPSSSAATPFGNQSGGFGGNNNNRNQNSFGSNNNNNMGGGNSSKKMPCKFFAKGQCRFGNNCKFSHDLNNTSGGGGGGGGGTTFGGGNNNGGGAFGGSSPFGAPSNNASPFGSSPFGAPRR